MPTIDLDAVLKQLEPDTHPDKFYVSVYTCERRYGGPEEGGWWYDWHVYHGSRSCLTRSGAEACRASLERWATGENREHEPDRWRRTAAMPDGPDPYHDTEGYIPRGWGDGGELIVVIEREAGALALNQRRPHYE